jgi:hypothetical protein
MRLKEAFSRLLHSEMQGPDERKQTFILYNYRDSKLPSSLASSYFRVLAQVLSPDGGRLSVVQGPASVLCHCPLLAGEF